MKHRAKKLLLLVLFTIINTPIHADIPSDQQKHNFYSIWLPGLYGGHAEQNSLLTCPHYTIYKVIKPASQADLGQEECIRHFKMQLSADQNFQQSKKVILIGSSQGAATLLNTIARMTHEEQESKIAALILEAPLVDGNEAIMHSALKTPGLAYVPLVRFWSPWVGKVYHRHYNPYGMQAVASAKHISAKIPIIIVHNKIDTIISVNCARKLVCEFLKARQQDEQNVYYIETDIGTPHGANHINFLRKDAQSLAAFHAVCKKLGLSCDEQQAHKFNDEDLHAFQPSVEHLEQLMKKDTWLSSYARNAIDGITLIAVAAALYALIKKKL